MELLSEIRKMADFVIDTSNMKSSRLMAEVRAIIDSEKDGETFTLNIKSFGYKYGIPLDADFVARVAAFAKENDILLVFDEVQTGNGRSGSLYAYMQLGVTPDIVTTAKGLGGGLPIGACLLGEKVQDVLGYGDHGSTFGGNPVCAAGALHVLSRIDEDFLAEVRKKSAYVVKELTGAPGVRSVSGMGLMLGIETEKPAADVVAACMAEGVLALTAKHKVRLLPALNIPMNVLKKAISIIKAACAE